MPPKRVITVTSTLNKDAKKPLPPTAGVVQPCLKCGNKCPGGYVPHLWRKECVNCGCTRDSHQSLKEYDDLPYLKGMLLDDASHTADKRKLDMKYAWYPTGIDHDMVERYMDCLPKSCVPYKGSKAEQQRQDQFRYQHPSHDTNVEHCHEMPELERKRMKKFGERRIKCFGVGKVSASVTKIYKCHGCSEPIPQGSVIVEAEENIRDRMWHPQCFRCSTCMELLVDLLYFYSSDKDEIYCGRHHGESIVPRCHGCDEIIFSGTYTEANGKKWHKNHFCCSSCETELHGKKYLEANEATYCEQCYEKVVSVECHKCKEKIGIGTKVNLDKYSWHAECFTCRRCKENLVKQKYYLSDGDLICSECKGDQAVAQCQGCKNAISSTVSFLQHKMHKWHAECFKCTLCQTWLANGEFHEMDESLMCTTCYTTKVGTKCGACQQPITSKGIRFGLKAYHQDCFKCNSCDKILIGESKVKEKDGEPICSDCHLKQVNKKCYRCKGPIISRHTLYKGRSFHIECFKCNICGSAIDNTTFFETSLNEILCARCVN